MAILKKMGSRCASLATATFVSTLSLSTAFADDTEVFFGQVDPNLDIFPNVLFVLDTSGSMNWKDGTSQSRLERMKDALDTILDNATNVNVGVMRFNGTNGGGAVLFPVTPIDKEICVQGNCGEQSAAPRTSESSHDAEESLTDASVSITGNILGLGSAGATPQIVGLHFDDLNIPQGAEITSAKLEFTANSDNNSDAQFNVYGELTPDADPFNNASANLSDRVPTSASADWADVEDWKEGLTYQSDQIDDVLQELVDQSDWCGGNAISLMIDGTGTRSARSFDQSASDAPILKFSYDSSNIPAGGGCTRKVHVSAISASTDDAEQRLSNGRIYARSGDLEMPYDRGNLQMNGLRFTGIKIPRGATIIDASIEFEVDRQISGDVSLTIQGESAGNAQTFGNNRWNISNRGRTGAQVSWDNIPNAAKNSKLTAGGLGSIVQEIVNRGDWSADNAMAFLFTRKSGSSYRAFETVDSEPVNAAKLRIEYESTTNNAEPTVITARDKLKEVVNGLTATGGTPIVDAYYEASRYYRGSSVDYGRERGVYYSNRYHRVSVPESYTGGTVNRSVQCTDSDMDNDACRYESITGNPIYKTPFRSSCQTNHIVFLSDGAATSNSAAGKVRSLTGKSTCTVNSGSEACGEELAEWLTSNDHSAAFNGKQNVSTYTIGFNFSSQFLSKIATAGGGSYFQADSSAQLVDVFQSILGDVLSVDTSFVAPGATVNQFNRLTHRNDIYFALFKPDTRPVWSGNLKRYEVGPDASGKPTIKDVEGKPAVDPTSGFFAEDSKSWWSTTADGNQVAKGGAAEKLVFDTVSPRKVYTYIGDNDSIPAATGIDLTATNQALSETNLNITLEHLGIANSPGTDADRQIYRANLLKWARGVDLQDDNEDNDTSDYRMHMGDPMHARPVILNYANGGAPQTTVFVGTNEGYLHAIERDNGTELFSYVPKELLDNFQVYWDNQSSDRHPYGLDGALSVWTTDENENVTIDPGEEAYLYTGMRRGGSAYYALNVANRLSPKLAWVIDQTTPGFEELGQTWSKMTPTKIRYEGEELDVLIFGAGYDENQDWTLDASNNQVARTPDSRGRGIYIVDAKTGALIYSALGSDGGNQAFDQMDYSMPSDIRILDSDFDGFADQMYASDLGGRIWRFDFKQFHAAGDADPLVKGGIIADLSGTAQADERRFYCEPDVAMISHEGERFLSISIGSGWRAHPLDIANNDRFYMIRSPNVFNAPAGYGKSIDGGLTFTPIVESDLINVSNELQPEINSYGWYYDLSSQGEKVLGASVTANNQVIFTTYRPALSVGACTTAIGGGSVYALSVLDGSPSLDLNGDGEIDEDDREQQLAHGGIPPPPMILITEPGNNNSGGSTGGADNSGVTLLVGPEQPFTPDIDGLTKRTYWVDIGEEDQ